MLSRISTESLARTSAAHPRRTLLIWVAAIVVGMFLISTLLGVLALWGVLGLVPWWLALVVSRGRSALISLPLAFAAGVGGGGIRRRPEAAVLSDEVFFRDPTGTAAESSGEPAMKHSDLKVRQQTITVLLFLHP